MKTAGGSSRSSGAGGQLFGDVCRVGAYAAAYFMAHQISFLFPDYDKILVAVWPAGGIGLAALLLCPRRLWTALLTSFFIAGCSASLLSGRPVSASAGFMVANILESLGCAWLIIRFCGEKTGFIRIREIIFLVIAATAVNACSAIVGAGTAALTSNNSFWNFWFTWLISDGLGILIIAPLIVTWSRICEFKEELRWYRITEAIAFTLLWFLSIKVIFEPTIVVGSLSLGPYLLSTLIIWPALRFGQHGMSFALLLLAVLAVCSHSVSAGPTPWGDAAPLERLLIVQLYLGAIAAAGLILAASYEERKSGEKKFRRISQEWQRTFDSMSEAVWILDKDQMVLRSNKAAELYFHRPCAEMVGKHCWEIVHGTTHPISECPTMRARKSLHHESVELQIGEGWFVFTADPILDVDGRFNGIVHIVNNITERKLTDLKMSEQLDELRRLHDSILGREIRVIEVKKEVNELLARLGEAPRYSRVKEE